MKKKVVAMLLCMSVVTGCLAGCGSGQDKPSSSAASGAVSSAAEESSAPSAAEESKASSAAQESKAEESAAAEADKDVTIKVGSKDFTESIVAANLYIKLLEHNGYSCEDKTNVSGSDVCQKAVLTGDFTVYPEYTGTIWFMIGEHDTVPEGGPEVLYDTLAAELAEAGDYYMGARCSLNDTFCFVVDPEVAGTKGITSLSELGAYMQEHPGEEKLACTNEFAIRPDGLLGMKDAFGIDFGSEVYTMEKGVGLKAVADGEVSVCMADATDSAIVKYGLSTLTDDGNYFPAYNMVPLYSAEFAAAHPDVVEVLDQLAPFLSDDAIRELNYAVDVDGEEPEDVAVEFLTQNGLIDG